MLRTLAACAAVVCRSSPLARARLAAPAARREPAARDARSRSALAVPHVASTPTGAVAVDLATGETVFARNAALLARARPRTRSSPSPTRRSTALGPDVPDRDGRARRGRAGRHDLARATSCSGPRRPDAHERRPAPARGAGARPRGSAASPARRRRRVVLRRAPHGARAGSRRSTSTSRRRSRRSSSTAAATGGRIVARPRARGGAALPGRARARGRRRSRRGRGIGGADGDRGPARRRRLARRSRAIVRCMDRDSDNFTAELAPEAARRGRARARHDRGGRRRIAAAARRGRRAARRACGSSTAPGSRSSTA